MAKLLKTKYPFPKYEDYGKNFTRYFNDSDEALSKIPVEKLYSYPVADGHAYYYIVSLSPLTLQHIDYMDGWELPDAHIRGLRQKDVLRAIDMNKSLAKLMLKLVK